MNKNDAIKEIRTALESVQCWPAMKVEQDVVSRQIEDTLERLSRKHEPTIDEALEMIRKGFQRIGFRMRYDNRYGPGSKTLALAGTGGSRFDVVVTYSPEFLWNMAAVALKTDDDQALRMEQLVGDEPYHRCLPSHEKETY